MKLLSSNMCSVLLVEKILEKVLKTIASNIPFEHFEFFCQKLQLKGAMIKTIESDRLVISTSFFPPLEQRFSKFLVSGGPRGVPPVHA